MQTFVGMTARRRRRVGINAGWYQTLDASFLAKSQPGRADTGAAGSKSSHPQGWPLTIRSMPMPSIMPPIRLPMTPAATPSQIISLRVIMGGLLNSTGWFDKARAERLYAPLFTAGNVDGPSGSAPALGYATLGPTGATSRTKGPTRP